ncbi:bola-like protein [Hypoxylon trugodes]|uniref:bola-like protein n=1 Tax=Hypoxylon trugodes TaxID=326681 RepID=UPI0021A05164|nr:bola-like protein [Hypoxylon trugodes]KAI1384409.1 bola-like protein [Hypoxylon trugodes]
MLCHHCRRLVATVVRRGPTTISGRARLIHTFTSTNSLPRAVLPSINSLKSSRNTIARFYSPASNTAAAPNASSTVSPQPEKPDYLDDAESLIWDKLTAEFAPTELMVQDISGGCGSMYGIEITSEKFRGVNMLKQQRMVNAVLGDQMKGWHGVQLRTKIP